MPIKLLLLARADCEHCERLVRDLQVHFPGHFELEVADVDRCAAWRRRYGLRIPVLLDPFGEVVSAGVLDPEALQELLVAQAPR